MNTIGIKIDVKKLPFELSEFEATLLFAEYPTTIVYADLSGNPVIREWVDVSDDYRTNQFFYYRTTKVLLKQFIEGTLPHVELINQATDGVVCYEHVTNQKDVEYWFAPVTWIPLEHKPHVDFRFLKEDGVDLQTIVNHFSLEDIELKLVAINQAKQISRERTSETLFLHLNKGKGIGFGTANTDILAKTLLTFDDLYKEAALDYKLGINRGDIDLTAKKNQEYLPYTTTEVYGNIAASFAVLIRPKFSEQNLFGGSDAENISKSVFSLISNSDLNENLQVEYTQHSEFTLKSYRQFVDEIYKQELNVNINWFSPISTAEFSNSIDYVKANKIRSNLENLTIETDDNFTVRGKFRSVNCDTGYFTFISTGGEKYSGYFDKLVRENSETINFIDIYEITVNRVIKKEAGKQEGKTSDTILAFIKEG